jgi:hypothetical protein
MVSEKYGMLLVGMIDRLEKVSINKIDYDASQTFSIIGDEGGRILYGTENFMERYFNTSFGCLQDYSLQLNDLFPHLREFDDDLLANGVETKMC